MAQKSIVVKVQIVDGGLDDSALNAALSEGWTVIKEQPPATSTPRINSIYRGKGMTRPNLNLIRTRTTFYRGRDRKARAVLFLKDYNALLRFCTKGKFRPARVMKWG